MPYIKQTEFPTTIKNLLTNFYDKFKESLKETISDQDAKFDTKFKKQVQTLSIHIKEDSTKFSLKLDDQDNKLSSFKASYNEHLKKMSSNKKVKTKVELLIIKIEATMNMRFNEFKSGTVR